MNCENSNSNNKSIFAELYSNDKYKKIIIIVGIIGIALIFFSGFIKSEKKDQEVNQKAESTSIDDYVKQLEANLTNMVSCIKGAGDCKVMVTIENGAQTIYATEGKKNTEDTEDSSNGELKRRQKSDDSETKYITVKGPNGEEEALAITEVQPTVKGVVVVCSGGDDPEVQQRIINAVTTALNITTKRVCVTK